MVNIWLLCVIGQHIEVLMDHSERRYGLVVHLNRGNVRRTVVYCPHAREGAIF